MHTGRGKPIVDAEQEQATTRFLVYLEELINPIDYRTLNSSNPQEFGYCSSRFATIEQLEQTSSNVAVLEDTLTYTS